MAACRCRAAAAKGNFRGDFAGDQVPHGTAGGGEGWPHEQAAQRM